MNMNCPNENMNSSIIGSTSSVCWKIIRPQISQPIEETKTKGSDFIR